MSGWALTLALSSSQDAQEEWGTGPYDTFTSFSRLHLYAGLGCLLVLVAIGVLGQSVRARPVEPKVRRTFFWIAFLFQIANLGFYMFPWEWRVSLPLHICDLAGIIATLSLISDSRALHATLYYWGIGLSTQAFITPVLSPGPTHIRFWMFFLSHLIIVGAAVYDLAARRFRPDWRDFRTMTLIMVAYGTLIIPFDIIFTFNYGYIGNVPNLGTPTLIDALGPWPLRLLWMLLIVEALFAILTAIWLPFKPPSQTEGPGVGS